MSYLEYANEHFEELKGALAMKDVVLTPEQLYKGEGVSNFFKVPEGVALACLGRKHFEGHVDFKFGEGDSPIEREFRREDRAVFTPLTEANIDAIMAGREFDYYVARNMLADGKSHVANLDPKFISAYRGSLDDLVPLIPKKRISRVTTTGVRVGNAFTKCVASSNPDDKGDIEISSISRLSSLLYNPDAEEVFRPVFHMGRIGGSGWQKPISAFVEGDKLFFDERQQQDGNLYLIDFMKDGYDPVVQDSE